MSRGSRRSGRGMHDRRAAGKMRDVKGTHAQVSTLDPAHLPAAVDVLVRAFWDYPETLHMLRRESTRAFGLGRFQRSACRDAMPFDEVLGAIDEGNVVGVAIWLPPSGYPISTRRQVRQALDLLPVGLAAPRTI